MKYILITGSPINGYNYEGPFDDPTAAGEFARETSPRNSKYWIAPIREPEEDSTFHYRPDSTHFNRILICDKLFCRTLSEYMRDKEIRHKDGDPRNYNIDNLELVPIIDTPLDRMKYEDDIIRETIDNGFGWKEENQRISRTRQEIADSDMNKADPADTESYAASLPGIENHDILDRLDEEDIPL